MKPSFTPKQVAKAIGVSESSLKRWCDRGLIPVVLTAGGHRRLPISGVLTFIRENRHPLVHPDLLGLPAFTARGEGTTERARERMEEALLVGDEEACRQLLFDLYFANYSISEICDRVLAPIFHSIGDRWECGELAIYRERRSCRLCVRMLNELRMTLAPVSPPSPVAIGGSVSGDHYEIAASMVELVLRAQGWSAGALGANLPFVTLLAAVQEMRPQLVWLSVSYIPDQSRFVSEFQTFAAAIASPTQLVIGGQALTPELLTQLPACTYCENMTALEHYLTSRQ